MPQYENPFDAYLAAVVSGDDPLVAGDSDDDPLVGYDEVGAGLVVPRMRLPQAAAVNRALAKPNTKLAAQRDLMARAAAGRQPATFLSANFAAIAAGATQAIQIQPANPIRIIDFTVDPTAAPLFDIQSILVGRINLLQSGNAIPASMFIPNSNRPPFEAPRLWPGQIMTINVTNVSGAVANFRAAFSVVDLGLNVNG